MAGWRGVGREERKRGFGGDRGLGEGGFVMRDHENFFQSSLEFFYTDLLTYFQ